MRNYKDIYIGKIIQRKVDEKHISYAEFARQIHCARTSLYHIFNAKTIDVERLLLISEILEYDFIGKVYGKETDHQEAADPPCVVLPIREKRFDFSNLPDELINLLKEQLP